MLKKAIDEILTVCERRMARFILSSGRVECPECFVGMHEHHKKDCAFNNAFVNLMEERSRENALAFLSTVIFHGRVGQFRNPRHGRVDCPECHWPVRHADKCKFGEAVLALEAALKEESTNDESN